MKKEKYEDACTEIRRHVKAANMALTSWGFHPLSADSAGGWTKDTQSVLQTCAKRVPKEKKGQATGTNLWRQRLAVVLKNENCTVMVSEVNACLGDGPPWQNWDFADEAYVDTIDANELDLIPGL